MFKKKLTKKGWMTVLMIALSLIVVSAAIAGVVSAKYIKQVQTPEKITVSAKLAEDIKVFEHVVTRQSDGSYITAEETTDAQAYVLMPGVDVPKDPTVIITGYTGMPAYVFVKIESDLPAPGTDGVKEIDYTVDSTWTALGETYPGVYYKTIGIDDASNGVVEIPVLSGDLVVSEKLQRPQGPFSLSFTAYIAQKITGQTAAAAYQTAAGITNP